MIKDDLIYENNLVSEDGAHMKIRYEIIVSENSYGIAISSFNNRGELDEFVEIKDISRNFLEIRTLFMVLYKYEVTPITLYDVLDVLLADFDHMVNLLN